MSYVSSYMGNSSAPLRNDDLSTSVSSDADMRPVQETNESVVSAASSVNQVLAGLAQQVQSADSRFFCSLMCSADDLSIQEDLATGSCMASCGPEANQSAVVLANPLHGQNPAATCQVMCSKDGDVVACEMECRQGDGNSTAQESSASDDSAAWAAELAALTAELRADPDTAEMLAEPVIGLGGPAN